MGCQCDGARVARRHVAQVDEPAVILGCDLQARVYRVECQPGAAVKDEAGRRQRIIVQVLDARYELQGLARPPAGLETLRAGQGDRRVMAVRLALVGNHVLAQAVPVIDVVPVRTRSRRRACEHRIGGGENAPDHLGAPVGRERQHTETVGLANGRQWHAQFGISAGAVVELEAGARHCLPCRAIELPKCTVIATDDLDGVVGLHRQGEGGPVNRLGRAARASVEIEPANAISAPERALPPQIQVGGVPGCVQHLRLTPARIDVQLLGFGYPLLVYKVEVAIDDDRLHPAARAAFRAVGGCGGSLDVVRAVVGVGLVAGCVLGHQVEVPCAGGVQGSRPRRAAGSRRRHRICCGAGCIEHLRAAAAIGRRLPGDVQRRPDLHVGAGGRVQRHRSEGRRPLVVHEEAAALRRHVARQVRGVEENLVAGEVLILRRRPGAAPASVARHRQRLPREAAVQADLHRAQAGGAGGHAAGNVQRVVDQIAVVGRRDDQRGRRVGDVDEDVIFEVGFGRVLAGAR